MILGLGDLAEAPEAIAYANQIRDITREWNRRAFTAAQAIPILETAVKAAEANLSRSWSLGSEVHGEVARGHQSDARRDLAQAKYLRKLMAAKAGESYLFAVGHKTWADVRNAVLAPIVWRSTVVATTGVETAAQAQLYSEIAGKVLNLPSTIIGGTVGYVVEQARDALAAAAKPLGIPAWVAPVAMVAAGLVVLGPYVAPMLARTVSGFRKGGS